MVIRSAIGTTATFAIQQGYRLVRGVNTPDDGLHRELRELQEILNCKIPVRLSRNRICCCFDTDISLPDRFAGNRNHRVQVC
jgi:hypothetical protein